MSILQSRVSFLRSAIKRACWNISAFPSDATWAAHGDTSHTVRRCAVPQHTLAYVDSTLPPAPPAFICSDNATARMLSRESHYEVTDWDSRELTRFLGSSKRADHHAMSTVDCRLLRFSPLSLFPKKNEIMLMRWALSLCL
jgi:hypothetical protein